MAKRKGSFTSLYLKKGKLGKEYAWLEEHLLLETIMGSRAFGTNNADSDYDVSVIVMPRRQDVYPQQYGKIIGLDKIDTFNRMELKGPGEVLIDDNGRKVEIDFMSLINFFDLAGFNGSPSVEILFARRHLVVTGSQVGWTLRDNKGLFVSLKNVEAIKGFAISQLRRIRSKKPVGKDRLKLIEQFGYDVRMASHVLRTLHESIQLLQTGDMDLMYNNEEYKLMKEGKWGDLDTFEKECQSKLHFIEDLIVKTKIPAEPPTEKLRALLANMLEDRYGSLSGSKQELEYISTKDVMDMFKVIDGKLDKWLARQF